MTSAWGADWRRDSRCQVIYNGLDTAPFAMLRNDGDLRSEFGVPASAHLYLHVGRMDPQKNHLRLLGMFKEVLALDSRAHLLLAGRGGDGEAEIRRRVTELELERCVTFAGLRCDIPALMGAADVLLLPSLQEGLPGVVLEACAAGLPVVASNLGGALEIQESFDAVACCSLADDDRIWAKAIVEARTHRIHRDARPTALRRFEQSPFALDRCVSQLASIWKAAPA